VVRYGNARELCLGLEVVTAQGDIWDGLSGLRKDNTGYDLRDLFIGSEGTLGIITAATMKLYPLPAAQLTAWAAVPSHAGRRGAAGPGAPAPGRGLTGFEVMGQFALSLVPRTLPRSCACRLPADAPYCVLLENSDTNPKPTPASASSTCWKAAWSGCVSDAVVAESLARRGTCGTCAKAFRWRRPRKA
jgi:FAD/FMN-containing dehydrogenase